MIYVSEQALHKYSTYNMYGIYNTGTCTCTVATVDTVYCTHLPVYVILARVLHRELHHQARSGQEGAHHLPYIQYTYYSGKVYTR